MLIKQKQQRPNIRACGLGPQGINAVLCTNTWLETNGNNSQLSNPCLKYYQKLFMPTNNSICRQNGRAVTGLGGQRLQGGKNAAVFGWENLNLKTN